MIRVPMKHEVIEIPDRLVEVQVRKHRKKRINKKWRKRYGVKLVLDLSCYLYQDYTGIKILAPRRVAQKIRDAIIQMEIGEIEGLKFRVADGEDKPNRPFYYQGGV